MLSANGLTTMDPSEAYYTNTSSILSGLVIRSLTQYVYDPDAQAMVLIPDLATDLGDHNKDYTEWKFTIREGVKYEDGTEVTPEDVRYGLLRSMDRAAFPTGASYSNEYFAGGAKYEGPITSGSSDFPGITVDGRDVTISMAKPFPDMPYWSAFPAISPMPEQSNKPAEYALHPLATGPYKFDEYRPGESLRLVRNDQWDAATDPGRHAYPDGYSFEFTEDSSQIDQLILSDQGDSQSTLTYDNLLTADFRAAQTDASDRLVVGGNPCTFFWWPDYRKITDVNVRKAIGLAYPYKDAWLAGGEIVGVTRVPGGSIMPPGIPGKPSYDVLGIAGENTDVQQAHTLLEEADAVGYKIEWLYATDDPNSVAVMKEVKSSLEDAGFTAAPVASTINRIPDQRSDPDFPINVRASGWCSDWPSGGSWMPPLFQTNGSNNYAQFSEQAVDDEIARIQSEVPLADQPAAWGALDQQIEEDYYPAVITGYAGVAMLHGSGINGMNNDDVLGMPTWKDMSITQ
ncbi:MAG: hypothetical protein H0V42_02555 [Nocardioidaceae bacterium]|nr:hypothetical protein [Nocardioidaceae bacterium]